MMPEFESINGITLDSESVASYSQQDRSVRAPSHNCASLHIMGLSLFDDGKCSANQQSCSQCCNGKLQSKCLVRSVGRWVVKVSLCMEGS